jgi:CHAT domain-containing protein/Tfp pilus assembly protein PilF
MAIVSFTLFCADPLLPRPLATAGARLISSPTQLSQGLIDLARGQQNIPALELGKPVEREMAGGQAHSYQLTLAADQFLRLVVDQRGIDVVVKLFGPDETELLEADNPTGAQGPEVMILVTKTAGNYRVEVDSLEKDSRPGRYEINLVELRVATRRDKDRVAAQNLSAEGHELAEQGTKAGFEAAIKKKQEALTLYRSAGDREGEADALGNIGFFYSNLGEMRNALNYYQQALPILQTVGDKFAETERLNDAGEVCLYLGDLEKALEYFVRALPLCREIGFRREEAITLSNMGVVYRIRGESQKALENYNQALLLRQIEKDKRGEAVTLGNIGVLYDNQGELQKALETHLRALTLLRELGDKRREALTLRNIGATYQSLGALPKAVELYDQALHAQQALGDKTQEAITFNNLGLAYKEMGDAQKALESYNRALSLYRDIGYKVGEATTLGNIGVIHSDQGAWQKAMENHDLSLALLRAVGDKNGEATALHHLGQAYSHLGEAQKALDYYSQALSLKHEVGDRRGEATALLDLAALERDQGNLEEAKDHLEKAVTLLEFVRAHAGGSEHRSSYFATVEGYYELYVDLLMKLHQRRPDQGNAMAALQVSERSRARSLLELLAESRVDIRQDVDPALLARERALQRQLDAKAAARSALLGGKHTDAQAAGASKELTDLTTQYQEIEAQIRDVSPRYAALTQPQPLSVAEIQRQVLDADTLLLEYALGPDHSYLWAVTPDSVTSYQLPPRAEIEASARRVYGLLTARQPRPGETDAQRQARIKEADAAYPTEAAALSRILLSPAASQMGAKRLLVVAPGMLEYLPFAVLPVPKAPDAKDRERDKTGSFVPLVAEHEIVHLPSASALAVLRRELSGRQPAANAVAALADPVFSPDDARVKDAGKNAEQSEQGAQAQTRSAGLPADLERAVGDARGGLRRLPMTRDEAEAILSAAQNETGLKAIDFKASRATAGSEELSHYRIVHFATHGLLDSERPELSGLALSLVDEHGAPQDGFLRLHQIYNLRLPAELVVLSACQTGLGKEVKGEGLVGLTRGFMYAGAARVAASLWQVNDAATAELMKRFYRGMLQEKLRPAAALRAAQIELWKKPQWQSPFYWGAFVLQGEWK